MNTKLEMAQSQTCKRESYELVKGRFTPQEARELLNDLLSKKISFHQLKCFSQFLKEGTKNNAAEQRIEELKLAKAEAEYLIQQAEEAGKQLEINSSIVIETI